MSKIGYLSATPWIDNGWTKARYFSFIRSALRSATIRYPAKQKYLESASYKAPPGGRAKKLVDCEQCSISMAKSRAHIDHIIPCGSLRGFDDVERFITTMFCGVDNFRVLCKPCNEIYAYCDKTGMNFDDARIEKLLIKMLKDLGIEGVKKMLLKEEFSMYDVANSQRRRDSLRILLKRTKK